MFCCTRKKSYKTKNNGPRKAVIVGDKNSGRSRLMWAMTGERWSDSYGRPCYDTYSAKIDVNQQSFELILIEAPGADEFDRLRPLNYPNTDIIIMCFAVDDPDSFKNITEKWVPECTHYCPNVPIILVGNKKDLRDEKMITEDVIHSKDGFKMAKMIGAVQYLEISAKTGEGIREILQCAACFINYKVAKK